MKTNHFSLLHVYFLENDSNLKINISVTIMAVYDESTKMDKVLMIL